MRKHTKKIEIIALVIYIAISISVLLLVLRWLSAYSYSSLGESVLNTAKITAASLEITDEQLRTLVEADFSELNDNEVSKEFHNLFEKADLSDDIEYAYVVKKLKSTEVKYVVEDIPEHDFFADEVGTPLNYMWLLDYVVNDELRLESEQNPNYYDDVYRYTSLDDETEKLVENEVTGYYFLEDEWGKQISGYVPIYTVEGTYIGLLGVDIFAQSYYEYRAKIIGVTLLLFLTLVLIFLYLYVFYYLRFKKSSYRDKLTGLFNRDYYEKYAKKILKRLNDNKSLTVIMLDIDKFKAYNDTYGHIKGDEVIVLVSNVIVSYLSQYIGCVGRFGGEEFIVLMPDVDISTADMICEQIVSKVQALGIEHTGGVIDNTATVSVGAYTVNGHTNKTLEQIIELADKGLYQAKNSGRNQYVRNID